MILKMSLATLLYILITAGLWRFCRKKPSQAAGRRVLIGLVFGACSVAANHLGITYQSMLLNVRDIGPLAAGLFFSPVSGIIAGLIGGAERYLASVLWDIGSFTAAACSLSTVLAGFFAAALNKWLYSGRRPPVPQAFLLGTLVEVLHMFSILIFQQSDLPTAYTVVQISALPMILFTAFGTAFCSFVVRKLSGEPGDFGWGLPDEKVPFALRLHRVVLVVTVVMFVFNSAVTYQLMTRSARDNISMNLFFLFFNAQQTYLKSHSMDDLIRHIDEQQYSEYYFVLQEGEDVRLVDSSALLAELTEHDRARLRELPEHALVPLCLESMYNLEMLCMREEIEDGLSLTVMVYSGLVYTTRDEQLLEGSLTDSILFIVIYFLIIIVSDRLMVRNLKRVNVSLGKITAGNLNEEVWVHSSAEFTELSDDINQTVDALRGYIHAAEKRMEDELKFAASIQASALPRNFSLPSGHVELYALMKPAKQVGGDFYDFFMENSNTLCLVIADVSGKGVPASLFMMRTIMYIRYFAHRGKDPAELLYDVNKALYEDNEADMFVTVWLAMLDLSTGRMRCVDAGHEYPALMREGGSYELVKRKHGPMLAIFDTLELENYEIQLHPGDKLFVYTDGVPEAMNEKEEMYGTTLMTQHLTELKNRDQRGLLEGMLLRIENFAGKAEQFDDITMLGISYK